MWYIPVAVGWLIVVYAAVVYIKRLRMRLWILLPLAVVFAASFAWWGFLCR